MTLPFEIALWFVMLTSVAYLIIITVLTYGWFLLKSHFVPETSPATEVSIVVAVRNEEKNILKLLQSILAQSYPKSLMEVVIVDDNSGDNTSGLITKFAVDNPALEVVLLSSPGKGKKEAVAFGIKNSRHQLIITTDGDCVAHKFWIRKIAAYFEHYQPKLILGPVIYSGEKGFFQKLFSLDFISLVASGAGGAGAGLPLMGNAANMAFNKSVFENEELQAKYASGDDVFLIHSVKKRYGSRAVHFLKDAQTVVTTKAPESLQAFFNQRIRWASKAKGYNDWWAVLVSMVVLLFNTSLSLLFVLAFWQNWLFAIWALFIFLKALIDTPLLNGFAQLTGKGKLLWYLLPMEFIYPFYIVLVSFRTLFFKYSWKERTELR